MVHAALEGFRGRPDTSYLSDARFGQSKTKEGFGGHRKRVQARLANS